MGIFLKLDEFLKSKLFQPLPWRRRESLSSLFLCGCSEMIPSPHPSAPQSRVCSEQRIPGPGDTHRGRGKNCQEHRGFFYCTALGNAFNFGIAEGMAKVLSFAQIKGQT